MQLFSWLHKWMTGRPQTRRTPARKPTPRFRPQLEVLEDRCVPSTLKVTNVGNGPGSLPYEIAQAQSNYTIVFDFGNKKANSTPHTIQLFGGNELYISGKNLTIQGPGAGLLTITSGPYIKPSRIFELHAATINLSGLTISNGGGRATASADYSYLDGYGGAILVDVAAEVTISGCILSGNWGGYGGAIYNRGGLTLSNCTLSGNSAVYGGGICNAGASGLTVSGCTVSGNTAADDGGGIYNAGSLLVSGSTLSGNSAIDFLGQGGGIYNLGAATVSACTLSGNSTEYGGGGIVNYGRLIVSNSQFSGNTPDNLLGPYTDGGGNIFN